MAENHRPNVRRVRGRLYLLLAGMLAVDFVFLGTTFLYDRGKIEDTRWSIAYDRGFPELFMYAQELTLIALCAILWRSTRQAFAWVWTLIFVFLFIDDAFMMHERVGSVFAEWSQIETRGMMRGQDYGELVAWTPFLVIFSALVLVGHFRSDKRHRLDLWLLYTQAAVLVGCGVVLDILSRLYNFWGHANITGGIEDGGEMVIVSLMVVHLIDLVRRNRVPREGVPLTEPA